MITFDYTNYLESAVGTHGVPESALGAAAGSVQRAVEAVISLLTLGIMYGYFLEKRTWLRVLIGVGTVPVAILANGLRVAGTGAAAHYIGPEMAEGFFHTFSGWLVFVASIRPSPDAGFSVQP